MGRGIFFHLQTVCPSWLLIPKDRALQSGIGIHSHTGALAGNAEIYNGLLHQLGIILSPTMELLLPLSHALLERPVMSGRRIAIFTMGGSWGVVLSDFLEEAGLLVPALSQELQKKLKSFGMPERASIKNPISLDEK